MTLNLIGVVPDDYGAKLLEQERILAFGCEVEENYPSFGDVVLVDIYQVQLVVVCK